MMVLRRCAPPLIFWMLGVLLLCQIGLLNNSQATSDSNPIKGKLPGKVGLQQAATKVTLPNAHDHWERLIALGSKPLFLEARKYPQKKTEEHDATAVVQLESAEPLDASIQEQESAPVPPEVLFRGYIRERDVLQVLLAFPSWGEERWVAIGDNVEDWSVADVSESMVRLENGSFEHVVTKSE
ncbi:hypothetical protein [Ruegeria sp.]|uniref:hypothetical protein n=1 Tax=Ruegeria sp. TaxID=1879320 RepID=UPI003C7CB5C5